MAKTTRKKPATKGLGAPDALLKERREFAADLLDAGALSPVAVLQQIVEQAARGVALAEQQATAWEAVRAKAAETVQGLARHYWRVRGDRAMRP